MTSVRIATKADAAGVREIYAPHVLTGACTFETQVPTLEEIEARIEKCLQKFPWLVCEINGQIAGYAYASAHREREAYQWTCECSVYVHEQHKGKRIGLALYDVLFSILKQQRLVTLYAGITLPNEASVRLHEKCGFVLFAEYDNVGYKLGAWHKVGWWKHQLNPYEPTPSPPLPFIQLNPQKFFGLFDKAAQKTQAEFTD